MYIYDPLQAFSDSNNDYPPFSIYLPAYAIVIIGSAAHGAHLRRATRTRRRLL